jgi:hypothetical protein
VRTVIAAEPIAEARLQEAPRTRNLGAESAQTCTDFSGIVDVEWVVGEDPHPGGDARVYLNRGLPRIGAGRSAV